MIGEYLPSLADDPLSTSLICRNEDGGGLGGAVSGDLDKAGVLSEIFQFPGEAPKKIHPREMLYLPKLRVRELLKHHPLGFGTAQAAEMLLLSIAEAEIILGRLADFGLIERRQGLPNSQLDHWQVLSAGDELVDQSAPKESDRVSAVSLLGQFLEHVATVNARDDLALRVAGVNVIGELLVAAPDETIPHLELTIILANRYLDPLKQAQAVEAAFMRGWDQCLEQGDNFEDYGYDWPLQEVQWAIEEPMLPVALRWHQI